MTRSKVRDRSKEQGSRLVDSDGSGSVISLQSSQSSDGKYPGNHHSASIGRSIIQAESVEGIDTQKVEGSRFKDDSTTSHHTLENFQKKLQGEQTGDTLDDIIHTIKNQNGLKDSAVTGTSMPSGNDSAAGGKTYPSFPLYTGSFEWDSTSPLQMSGYQNERQAKQLKDMTTHFECEIHKFYEQLNSVGSGLIALQDALPVKMLEAATHKLETRCNGLEKAYEQMKNKSAKLEQANQALVNDCRQLQQINQDLEVRCLYLEQISQASEKDKTQLDRNVHDLEDKVKELAASNEKAIGACCQLEELNQKCVSKLQAIEESKKLLESRYKSCVSENEKLDNQLGQYQKTVDQYKKKFQEYEDTVVTSKQEKENLLMKLESANKAHMHIKEKYRELKSTSARKEELIPKLEDEMRKLSASMERAIKEKIVAEGNSERDKELLEKMLIEYDVLAREYQEAQESYKVIHVKLELSQNGMANLREIISKLAFRNSILEEASKDNDNLQQSSYSQHIEQSTGKNRPQTGRKTWSHSTPIKKRQPQLQSPATYYTRPEIERDQLDTELAPSGTSLAHPNTPTVPDAMKVTSPSTRKQDLVSNGPKTSTPARRKHMKSATIQDGLESIQTAPPSGMMVKKANLLTKFDVVFEDKNSGEEMVRTHMGRTWHVYNEPVQTESNFISNGDEAAVGIAACNTRLLTADDFDSTVSEPRRTKSKQNVMYNVAEKDIGNVTSQAASKDNEEEHQMHAVEKKFFYLTEERKRLESALSRIPGDERTKRSAEDRAYLESRLDEVAKELAMVRAHLRKH